MAKRLVLNAAISGPEEDAESQLTVETFLRFAEQLKKLQIKPRQVIGVSTDIDGVLMYVPVPENTPLTAGKRSVRRPTKKQTAVKEQITKHKEEVKAGKKVAHVPPVKGTVKRKTKKHHKTITKKAGAGGSA